MPDIIEEWNELHGGILEMEQDLQAMEKELASARQAHQQAMQPTVEALKERRKQVEALRTEITSAEITFTQTYKPLIDKIAHYRVLQKEYRMRLKERAVDNSRPRTLPGGGRVRPPNPKTFGGTQLAFSPKLRILNPEQAAIALAEVEYQTRAPDGTVTTKQLAWWEPRFDARLVLAYLKADPARIIPGVLELTTPDDTASYSMRVLDEDTMEGGT